MKRLLLSILLVSSALVLHAQTDTTTVSTTLSHTVTSEHMNKGLVTSGLGALSGQSAGVTVSGANQAAMLSAVRVRGTTSLTGGNDPLVIIDGVIADLATLGSLYPGDIEMFTILKDASETALYGSRGASGVIRVTTRRGAGGAFRMSYDVTSGFEAVSRNLKMLDAEGFRNWNDVHGYPYTDGGFDSDMPSSILRLGTVQNHHLAFGGGGEQSHYRASIGILDHKAVVKTQRAQNYSIKLDIGQKAFNRIDVDLGVFGFFQKNASLHDAQHLFYSSAAFNPTIRPGIEPDGSYTQIPSASQINHPVSLLEKQATTTGAHFNTHLGAKARMTDDVDLSAFVSYSYTSADDGHFFPTIVWSGGEAYRSASENQDFLGNLTLGWHRDFGKHHIDLNSMAEVQRTINSRFWVTSTNFTTNVFGLDAIQAGADRPWEGTASCFSDIRMLSLLMGAGYKYGGKFSLNANLRADASSLFGDSNLWGLFPSVSATWNASENLKFSAGYGFSGNQGALEPYNSLSTLAPGSLANYEGTIATAFTSLRNPNPDLRWEVRESFNAGMESNFLDKRIVFTAEYYYSLTRDMLYNYMVSVPPFAFNTLMANLGKMSNSGVELGLGVSAIRKKDLQMNVNMNLTFQRNKLISLSGYWNDQYLEAPEVQALASMNGAGFHGGHNDVVFQIIGQPLGVFYLPHCTGLSLSEDGSYRYETDGVSRICGQASPKALLGSNVSLRYKEFDLSVQLNGAFGHKIFNGTALTYMNMGSLPYYNVLADAPEANIQDQTVTDYWLEKGDYLNVDYVTLGWNLPLKRSLKNLRLSASVNNLCTLTSYSGLTPMINSSVVDGTFGLDDKVSYPVYRSYTLALSIQF